MFWDMLDLIPHSKPTYSMLLALHTIIHSWYNMFESMHFVYFTVELVSKYSYIITPRILTSCFMYNQQEDIKAFSPFKKEDNCFHLHGSTVPPVGV